MELGHEPVTYEREVLSRYKVRLQVIPQPGAKVKNPLALALYNLWPMSPDEPVVYVHVHGYILHSCQLPHLLHYPGEDPKSGGETEQQGPELPKVPSVTESQEPAEPGPDMDMEVGIREIDAYPTVPGLIRALIDSGVSMRKLGMSMILFKALRSMIGLHFPLALGTLGTQEPAL